MDVLRDIAQQAKQLRGRVIFPEGDEDRTLEAAVRLTADNVCSATVTAESKSLIERTARRKGLDIAAVNVVSPAPELIGKEVLREFVAHKMRKGLSEEQSLLQAMEPLYFAALYAKSGGADSMVAGARADTADVLRAALYGIGSGQGAKTVSSFFLMLPPADHPVVKEPVFYADCAVNPEPTASELEEIARATIRSCRLLFPERMARTAFLSFSTRGGARHSVLQKIRQAVKLTQDAFAGDTMIAVDGEMQFDAAVMPPVASVKAPGSPVGGHANVFIFPDLNAGNICYKMTERLAFFKAIGPVLQGTAMPVSDLSRGCSVEDIYDVATLTLLLASRAECGQSGVHVPGSTGTTGGNI